MRKSWAFEKLSGRTLNYVHSLKLFPNSPLSNPDNHDHLLDGYCFELRSGEGKLELMAIGGVVPIWRGVGEVWIAVLPEAKTQPLSLVRSIKTILSLLSDSHHRVQMTSVQGDEVSFRWAKALGFTCEGLMIKYGPDEKSHYLHSLTWD